MIRFEILLPRFYNDGRAVEREKFLETDDTPESWQAVRDMKETLKRRFDQLDIWITAHRIDVI